MKREGLQRNGLATLRGVWGGAPPCADSIVSASSIPGQWVRECLQPARKACAIRRPAFLPFRAGVASATKKLALRSGFAEAARQRRAHSSSTR